MEFKLIQKYINGTLSDKEQIEFDTWLNSSPEHQEYYQSVLRNSTNRPIEIDSEKGWVLVNSKLSKTFKLKHFFPYAAILALTFGALYAILAEQNNAEGHKIVGSPEKEQVIDRNKPTLTLDDGSTIVLTAGKNYTDSNVTSNGTEIIYKKDSEKGGAATAYNILTIPRGGQFFLTLSDKTKVWLNSESKLKFPKSFSDKESERVVELLYGEAYFDVSSSELHNGKEFRVISKGQNIQVLGTEFNIKAYANQEYIATTLIEGKVQLHYGDLEKSLNPNQKSVLNLKSTSIQISEVDVFDEISWKNGLFSFKDLPLEEIMETLARWYDIEVFFANPELTKVKFTGVFSKKQAIDNILTIIESTNELKFETIGKTVKVK
ncbi:DUF4974 domain-containing protein [Cellulophaga lytica]|nr:DUF4974 domain-containing protein [Cellulophaga lytica]